MLNLNKEGRPFAKIIGGRHNNQIVSISDKSNNGFKYLGIASDAKFQLIPSPKTEREILYITGPSGSGKSTFVRKYLEQYKKTFKDRNIYLFSSLPNDESLDDIEPKRVRIDEEVYTDPIPIKEFENSVIIFDDIDAISDTKVRDAVYSLLNQVLEIGRHFNITCLMTNHLPSNRGDTRRVLSECSGFIYFPRSSSSKIK
jgi:Cdc6-like AAA superfamily ATPase